MRETDATIARMWADHTSREIGAIIGRSAEYVRVRAQRLDLPKKRETRGGWQRKANSALPAISNRGSTLRLLERKAKAPARPQPQPKPMPRPQRIATASPPIMRFETCQWINGSVGAANWRKCDKPTENGSAWCDEHRARVFVRRGSSDD